MINSLLSVAVRIMTVLEAECNMLCLDRNVSPTERSSNRCIFRLDRAFAEE